MNGFMLLVLVVLAGQISPPGQLSSGGLTMPPSLNPVQPASMVTTPPPQADYGWQINPETGLLEYIVQISPDKAEFMYKNSKEQESIIPAVVAARVSKIIVRFGTKPIQSTPIEEVLQLPLVNRSEIADNMPSGRIKTLENSNGFDVQNVAGGAQPPPLNSGGIGSSLTDATTSLSDKMANALRDPESMLAQNRTNPGASLLQDTMGMNPGAGTTPFPSSLSNPNGLPTSTATTPPPALPGFNNSSTAPLNPNGYGSSNTTANPNTYSNGGYNQGTTNALGSSNLGTSNVGVPSLGTPGMGTAGMGAGGYSQPHSTATNGTYTGMPGQSNATLGTNGTLAGGGTRPGFASAPLGTSNTNLPWSPNTAGTGYSNLPNYGNTTGFNNQAYANSHGYTQNPGYAQPSSGVIAQSGIPYANNQYAGSQYTGTQNTYLPSDPLSLRVADNRTAVPSTSGTSPSSNVVGGRSSWGNRTDGYPDYNDSQLAQRTGVENAMPVMFVLSLVVNVYLGMLIRKLLGRYRNLLASVRSQTV